MQWQKKDVHEYQSGDWVVCRNVERLRRWEVVHKNRTVHECASLAEGKLFAEAAEAKATTEREHRSRRAKDVWARRKKKAPKPKTGRKYRSIDDE
jgi:DNA invertase Pin-like site-specific DNA recombinase